MNFDFATPTRILFGEGRLREAGRLAAELGSRALVVAGGSRPTGTLMELLHAAGVATDELRVPGEPTTALVERGVDHARTRGCDFVVALGGGSAIDTGKAVAALLTNRGSLRAYLEGIGRGQPITVRSAPLLAIPTTAGSGAEVTRNAVLTAEEERVKVSLRSPLMLPALALVDPELTYGLPPAITASTGMDALTQCIEPFVTPQANPLTDGLAREGMRRAAGALRRACQYGDDVEARRDMAIASLCGGLALANAKLGAVHGLAAPLGGMFPIPHGTACARLLPAVTEANVRVLRARASAAPALARYDEVARILTGSPHARPEDGVDWLLELAADLRIPALSAYGVKETDLPAIADQALRASSMQGNPVALTGAELAEILRAAM